MKTDLAYAVLECLVLLCCLQHFGLAVPTLQANERVVAVSSDIKRYNAEYRNALFGVYHCRVKKATEAVRSKLQVSFQ